MRYLTGTHKKTGWKGKIEAAGEKSETILMQTIKDWKEYYSNEYTDGKIINQKGEVLITLT